jgi:hypothetical protein
MTQKSVALSTIRNKDLGYTDDVNSRLLRSAPHSCSPWALLRIPPCKQLAATALRYGFQKSGKLHADKLQSQKQSFIMNDENSSFIPAS